MKTAPDLTGIVNLRGILAGQTAAFCCSGTSLITYDDAKVPSQWPRFAVNEAIRKLGESADYWVLSDDPIALEYGSLCPPSTAVLCMHEARHNVARHCKSECIYTVQSTAMPKDEDDGVNFFSRGTVLIGALEMARYMGVRRAYVFGLDCYRTRSAYYFDGRRPLAYSENVVSESARVRDSRMPPDMRAYSTPRLRIMTQRLRQYVDSGLPSAMDIHVVGSEFSQQGVWTMLSWADFIAEQRDLPLPPERDDEPWDIAIQRGEEGIVPKYPPGA